MSDNTRVEDVQAALSKLRGQITQKASAATRQAQAVRSACHQGNGLWSVTLTIVPIGGAGWSPDGLELELLPGGSTATVSRDNWTARWEDVEAGEYRIVARERCLTTE